MRLSELTARCGRNDPELMVEDQDGIPRPVTDADLGVMLVNGGAVPYVLLEPANGED